LCLVFVAVTIVWLYLDQDTPNADAGRHFEAVFDFREQGLFDFRRQIFGDIPLYWFEYEKEGPFYPPLVYLIGALGTLPRGLSMDGPVLAINVVFVPVFAAGCYGVAREAFGRAAGLPAAIFALAAPMAIGQFHILLPDLPLAAMVAVTTWVLLASNRFENARMALAAGVLAGLGMLTKQPFVVFVAPVAALIIVRGGWRNWRGVALFCAAAAVIAGPWYIRHLDSLRRVAGEATAQAPPGVDTNQAGTEYTRFSLDNYEWYGWAFVNLHWYLPLALAFVGGAFLTLRLARHNRKVGYVPELIVGFLAGYVGVAFLLGFQDARYSFPSACFVAALGVGWVARARPRVRSAVTLALVALFVLNMLTISTGALGNVVLRLPGGVRPSPVEGNLVLLADHGYTSGKPERARMFDLLEAAAKDGVTAMTIEEGEETQQKLGEIEVLARTVPIRYLDQGDRVPESVETITLYRRAVRSSDPRPCQRFSDGMGLYVLRAVTDDQQRSTDPRRAPNLYCPL
jgi:4-amino-4-deoxy-L-arabinose transferase-like glycosyltransferase